MDVRDATSDETLSAVWQQLKKVRQIRNKTQKDMEADTGITQGGISRMESGNLYPSDDSQNLLAKSLEFEDADALFEVLARFALIPSSLNEWSFGPRGLDEKNSQKLYHYLKDREGEEYPEVYEELMGIRKLVRLADAEEKQAKAAQLKALADYSNAMVKEAAAQTTVKVRAKANAEVIKGKSDHHVLEAETGKFVVDGSDVEMKLKQGIGSLRPKRGRSLLNMEFKKDHVPLGQSPSEVMPVYKQEAPRDFELWGSVTSLRQETTAIPPMLTGVTGPYAVQLHTNHMAPRYSSGDLVYVNPSLPPYYGDDVSVQLLKDGVLYSHITRIVRMETVEDKLGNTWTGYGCIAIADENSAHQDALYHRHGQDAFEDDRDGLTDWFYTCTQPQFADISRGMLDYPEGIEGGENRLIALDIHVVVGCERKRVSDNFERPNPRMKRQLEHKRDIERELTPYVPDRDEWQADDALNEDFNDRD